ncbi:MAG: DUF1992 domain-containing protein [Yoonia sp.]|jgi:hypothetical protein|nr:DUF1992 domain-containing protein [Yoonia sp.]
MAHPLEALIDQIVQKAQARGDLDNLSGAGKPLNLEGNAQDAVLARIMSEADAKAPVVILRNQILDAQETLKSLTNDAERRSQMIYLAELQTKLAIEMEAFRKYG